MRNSLDKNKVVLGLSGGVDSTTAALLLQEKGFTVIGLYLDVLGTNQKGREQAQAVAQQLGIQFICKNVSQCFRETVIGNFCSEYLAGRTPNPCIVCNPNVKFKTLLQAAEEEGAYYIATGHYAGTVQEVDTGIWYMRKARNEKKDQSYMLYRLPTEVISRLLLPLEEVESKEDTRKLAKERNLSNAELKDSQEICFIPEDQTYVDYIQRLGYEIPVGQFVDDQGTPLGTHSGIINYTIGQRKGLGITFGKPVFVTAIDAAANKVTLGSNEELFHKSVFVYNNFFTSTNGPQFPNELENRRVMAKIRYAAKPSEAVLKLKEEGVVEAIFTEPQRAPSPGQSMVFYVDNRVVGGGFIQAE